jgi:hypothetical protein
MSETDFKSAILETEVIVTHVEDGHVYHFPVLSNGTVSLHGSRIEANPLARRNGRTYFSAAYEAARIVFRHAQV